MTATPPPSASDPGPRPTLRRAATRKRRRAIILLSAGLCLALATVLVLNAMRDSVVFFFSPSELAEREIDPERLIRIGGLVEDGSVRRADDGTIHFAVTDLAARVAISYQGILPDLFREGQGIVAQGWLGPDGAFRAREVLAKHDETYMPKEVADALKRAGMWQHAAPPADSPADTPAYTPAYAPAHATGDENPEGASIP